jgi:hypothetical protein
MVVVFWLYDNLKVKVAALKNVIDERREVSDEVPTCHVRVSGGAPF